MWWEQSAKPRIQRLLQQTERKMFAMYKYRENMLYECMYEVINSNLEPPDKLSKIGLSAIKIVGQFGNRFVSGT
jgi:hypothetical protein